MVSGLAKERAVWALRPLGFLYLVLWIFHPHIAVTDMAHTALLGFILGALYGVVVCWDVLKGGILAIYMDWKDMPNRMPTQYYWGNITNVMFDNK